MFPKLLSIDNCKFMFDRIEKIERKLLIGLSLNMSLRLFFIHVFTPFFSHVRADAYTHVNAQSYTHVDTHVCTHVRTSGHIRVYQDT